MKKTILWDLSRKRTPVSEGFDERKVKSLAALNRSGAGWLNCCYPDLLGGP